MRISDWSSDVCSSDLGRLGVEELRIAAGRALAGRLGAHGGGEGDLGEGAGHDLALLTAGDGTRMPPSISDNNIPRCEFTVVLYGTMDRFRELETFLAVAEAWAFNAAARRLRQSPPAITRLVKIGSTAGRERVWQYV